nr:hypothetical protein [Tanacetum cinerariifolium]
TYETLGDLVQRFHDHTQAIPVHRIQTIEGIHREKGRRIVGFESAVIALTERVAELEKDNQRLRGTASVESQRVDRLQRGMKMPNTQSRASMTHEEIKELIAHRVAEEMEAREDVRNLEALNENEEEQEGENEETVFNISNYPPKYQVKYATCTLQNSALTWWNSHKRTIGAELMKLMTEVYCLRNEVQKMEAELWNLNVKGNDLTAYIQRFQELILLCTRMVPDEEDRVERFIGGLPDNIQGNVIAANLARLQDAIRIANQFEEVLSLLLGEGNLKEATTIRKAIALMRQAIRSSPEENTGTTKLESMRGDSIIGCVVSNVDWDELIYIEMVKTIVEVEDYARRWGDGGDEGVGGVAEVVMVCVDVGDGGFGDDGVG